MTSETLIAACQSVASLGREAEAWLEDARNAERVGPERAILARSVRKLGIKAQRLEAAAGRSMSVAVFGPSQVGKSYLVSVIASPEGGAALEARFDGLDPIDFLQKINPAGEKESTGLVTRFTTQKAAQPTPPGFPVSLRLLSELDIIKILGNTYFNEGDQTKEDVPSADDLRKTVESLSAVARFDSGLTLDDIIDLQDYFQKHFVGNRLIDIVSHYWKDVERLAPKLDLEGRAKLFGWLWGSHEKFTWLYKALTSAIERLGRAPDAYAAIEALMPRETSVIDVATLGKLGLQDDASIELQNGAGVKILLPRALATALIAELRIEMARQPRAMFAHTDLLDFPGARSRQKFHLTSYLAENESGLKETFLRGKVAYLFDRYVAEQELTAMMLCVRPSAQEVVTLPDMIDEWIGDTHGRTPQARIGRPVGLFFVLTWFDTHFIDKAGDTASPSGRFKARLEASLLGFFGKAHSWPHEWTPGKPFANSFWFRNPNYPAPSIIRYDGRREVEVLPDLKPRIDELREGFLSIPEAERHFADPGRAFDEGLRLNDGGAGYIVENLERVCRPDLKDKQVMSALSEVGRDIVALIERFHVPLDVGTRLTARREVAGRVFDTLEVAINHGTFATFLRLLMIDTTEMSELIYAALRAGFSAPEGAAARPPASGVIRPGAARPKATDAPPPRQRAEHQLAQHAIDAFIARLRRLAESEIVSRTTHVPREETKEIVDEIIGLVRRTKLQERLAERIAEHVSGSHPEPENAARIALVACAEINRLVGDLGFGKAPADQRPDIDGESKAFEPRSVTFDAKGLGAQAKPFASQYASAWFAGFYKIVEDNATSAEGIQVDLGQNDRLKAVIDGLRAGTK
ncbi:virulence factor SrfC family protein [Methylorubrum extorquens]|uniref:Virulence factor SrfC-like protein n=1 Tax=Methylorubrum extorquens (strain CM4 / NCIMB 13688) TaxID=440085 RepID=B7KW01_METC4|nr:virulence factor SrfC family protein [Methylorubrum extorquens]ACK82817.1 virulence factor SrfC-like protein [Methylorubrum extorquens CM4]